MQYRTHDDGPLTTIKIEPGAVIVEMHFDMPESFVKLHSHTFDHWMECVKGAALISIENEGMCVREGDTYFVSANKKHGVRPLQVGTILRCRHENSEVSPDGCKNGIPSEWLNRLTNEEEHEI